MNKIPEKYKTAFQREDGVTKSVEAYALLGDYYLYEKQNVNQAFLCYEYSYYHSENYEKVTVKEKMDACRLADGFEVHPVSFVILSYNSKSVMVNYIKQDLEAPIQILIVNNRFSCLATKIQFKYPNAQVHSIENNVAISSITSKLYDARCLDIEKDRLPYSEESFDYIFMLDAFEQLKDPADTLQYLKKFLKHDGHFILRARNANHISVLESLAYGNLAKPKVATCVQRGAKLYTTDDMSALLQENGFQISQLTWIYHTKKEPANEAQKRILDTLLSLPDAKDENTFLHTGVVFDAVREL